MQNLLAMLRDGAIYTAAANGRVAMVDARDAAAVAVAALTLPYYTERIGSAIQAAGSSVAEVGQQLGDWLKRTKGAQGDEPPPA